MHSFDNARVLFPVELSAGDGGSASDSLHHLTANLLVHGLKALLVLQELIHFITYLVLDTLDGLDDRIRISRVLNLYVLEVLA